MKHETTHVRTQWIWLICKFFDFFVSFYFSLPFQFQRDRNGTEKIQPIRWNQIMNFFFEILFFFPGSVTHVTRVYLRCLTNNTKHITWATICVLFVVVRLLSRTRCLWRLSSSLSHTHTRSQRCGVFSNSRRMCVCVCRIENVRARKTGNMLHQY